MSGEIFSKELPQLFQRIVGLRATRFAIIATVPSLKAHSVHLDTSQGGKEASRLQTSNELNVGIPA